MSTETPQHIATGKPSDEGDLILRRRYELVRTLAPPKGGAMLDFGCGHGAQTCFFLPHFETVVGADIDPDFLAGFERKCPAEAGGVPLPFDGRTLPLEAASIDYVTSFEVLEHVDDETRALDEIHRVLRPGGVLAMSVPNRWWIFETHGAALPLLPWNRVPFFSWLPKSIHDRYAHARNYRRREIVAKLEAKGFEVERAVYVTAPMDVVRTPWLKSFLRRTIFRGHTTAAPFLATAVLVIARKR